MKQKWLVITVIYATSVLLLCVLAVIALQHFGVIEYEEVVEDVEQAQSLLQSEISQLLSTAGDYAGWDDTYAFVNDLNQHYVIHSLGSAYYDKLRLSLFCIVSLDGKVVYSRYGKAESSRKNPLPADLKAYLTPRNPLFRAALQQKQTGGFVVLQDGLLMIAAHPVLTTESKGPVRGMLLIGRYVTTEEVQRIGSLAKFTVGLLTPGMPEYSGINAQLQKPESPENPVHVSFLNSYRIRGYSKVLDINNRQAGLLYLEKERQVYLEARKVILALTLFSACVFSLVAIVFLRNSNKLAVISMLEKELLKQHTRQGQLAVSLSLAEEKERVRIAEELHDQVGPTLLSGKMKLNMLQSRLSDENQIAECEAIDALLAQSVKDIRSLTLQLRPPILANAGLEAAIKWLTQEFSHTYGLQIEFTDDGQQKTLQYEKRTILFQAVRELLLNVVKHARCSLASVSMQRHGTGLIIVVTDNGTGFKTGADTAGIQSSGGFGLFNITQKLSYIHGQLTIDHSVTSGARVVVDVPLDL